MKPSPFHPWRQYQNKPQPTQNGDARPVHKPLQFFLQDITTGWNHATLPIRYRGKFENYTLTELPDKVIAIWLTTLLRRYISARTENEEEFDSL